MASSNSLLGRSSKEESAAYVASLYQISHKHSEVAFISSMKSSEAVPTGAPEALAPPEHAEDALSASDLDEPLTHEEAMYMSDQHDMLSATLGAAILPHAVRSSIVQYDTSKIRPSVRPTVGPTVHPSALHSVHPSVDPTVRPSYRPTVRLTVRPSDRPSVRSSVWSIRPSDCSSVECIRRRPTVRPSVRLIIRPPDCPSVRPLAVRSAVGRDGRTKGQTDGRSDRRTLARTDGRKDGRAVERTCTRLHLDACTKLINNQNFRKHQSL